MRKKFDEVVVLGSEHTRLKANTKKPVTIGTHLQKLSEEFGELAQGVNKLTGLKSLKKNETSKKVKANIKEEVADCIQIVFIIAHLAGFTYADVKKELGKKNRSYGKFIKKLEKKIAKKDAKNLIKKS